MPRGNNLPMQQGMLHRPRLHALIRNGLQFPLLVMLAGPGYGKTQAMSDYLQRSDARVLWLRLNSMDNLHTHFWEHLVYSLDERFPKVSKQLSTLGYPDTPPKFDIFLRILAADLDGRQTIWVLDDFGEITDPLIKGFFWTLTKMDLVNFHVALLSNVLDDTESIAFMTRQRALILGKDLRFTKDEITELYAKHEIPLEAEELDEVERYTEGWPLPLHLLVMQQGQMPELVQEDGRLTSHTISHMFEEHFFSAYPQRQQKLLVKLSLLDSFTKELATSLYEGEEAELETLGNHVFLNNEPASGRFVFHYLYRMFLRKKRYLLTGDEERELWRHTAEYYMTVDDVIDAIACYRRCGDHAGMLNAISDFVRSLFGVSSDNAAFILDQLDLLEADEARANPLADLLRALLYLNTLELDKAEALLLELERRLLASDDDNAPTFLGEAYAMLGDIHMMRNREDFGDYFEKAAGLLPQGTTLQNKRHLSTLNNHNFSMADSKPGARQRMERAVHRGIPWAATVLGGTMSGMEHVYSAEAAYLSFQPEDAQQHAYRAIYQAQANDQHDLVCNAYCILARVGLLQGNLAEMTKQVQAIEEYTAKYPIGVLKEIRDTAFGWYYIKLRDFARVPKSIAAPDNLGRAALAYDRAQIVHANLLINTGEFARLVGMLEYPRGLYLTGGIWPDRICLYIMLAIGYLRLEKPQAAMNALWTAYDMSHENGLTTLFIEAGSHMCALVEIARTQREHAFSPEWLEHIHSQAAAFDKRAEAVRAAYRRQNPAEAAKQSPLTRREVEILQALSVGLTREEIAAEQYISVNTVKTFIRSIYNKLDAANRAEAVSIAIANGYIDVSPPK